MLTRATVYVRCAFVRYGRSKLKFELMLQESPVWSRRHVVLRSSNMIGPRSPYTKTGKFLQWIAGSLLRNVAEGQGEGNHTFVAPMSTAHYNNHVFLRPGTAPRARFKWVAHGIPSAHAPPPPHTHTHTHTYLWNKTNHPPTPHYGHTTTQGKNVSLFDDEWRSFVAVGDVVKAVRAAIALRASPPTALRPLNCGGPDRLSRAGLGALVADVLHVDRGRISTVPAATVNVGYPSPPDLTMESSGLHEVLGLVLMPPRSAVEEACAEILAEAQE
jgi:nucleoside-diphosphate-sugar epimerase